MEQVTDRTSSVQVLLFTFVSSQNKSVLFSNLCPLFLFGQGNLRKLLTMVNLLHPNSAIMYFGCYGGGVENSRRPDCLE
jgi:hypothetical protein